MLNEGKVWADGAKRDVFTADRLSELYGVGIGLVESSGWYQAVPV